MQSKTALLVDGDEFFRAALGGILQRDFSIAGVLEASSFDDALQKVSDGPADLIVVASGLLDDDGYAQIRALRECFPQTAILTVAPCRRRRHVLVALAAGANGVIVRDGGVASVASALRCVLEGGIYVPPFVAQPDSFDVDAQEEARDPTPHSPVLQQLSPRQREVLELVVAGKSNKEIARALRLGEGTVKVHMSALFRALDVRTRSAAAAIGAKLFSDRLRAA